MFLYCRQTLRMCHFSRLFSCDCVLWRTKRDPRNFVLFGNAQHGRPKMPEWFWPQNWSFPPPSGLRDGTSDLNSDGVTFWCSRIRIWQEHMHRHWLIFDFYRDAVWRSDFPVSKTQKTRTEISNVVWAQPKCWIRLAWWVGVCVLTKSNEWCGRYGDLSCANRTRVSINLVGKYFARRLLGEDTPDMPGVYTETSVPGPDSDRNQASGKNNCRKKRWYSSKNSKNLLPAVEMYRGKCEVRRISR